ncbi:helix-turn-helix domain-containing protein [Brevibacterium moorei]|uniref:helix-turn-helix domain-containing protein n=1 Tax=Brevibacterium moorei TaxID=2968457 RepID=UPI00211C03AC|nr:helix-turn-helix transcriptional regulator [Brevibacterium sp. 68QC2CO]MCQ9386798.1 helix-turn-helix domain-containing protein [Brevibacterium sp. 68QC2CO]
MTIEHVLSVFMTQDQGETWPERQAKQVGVRVKQLREQAGLTASQVADTCTKQLDYKLNRTALNNLEAGLRKSVTVAEIAAIATAIGAAPLSLLIDIAGERDVEFVGNNFAKPWDAWRWWVGEKELPVIPGQDNELATQSGQVATLMRELATQVDAYWNLEEMFVEQIRSDPDLVSDLYIRSELAHYANRARHTYLQLRKRGMDVTLPDKIRYRAKLSDIYSKAGVPLPIEFAKKEMDLAKTDFTKTDDEDPTDV